MPVPSTSSSSAQSLPAYKTCPQRESINVVRMSSQVPEHDEQSGDQLILSLNAGGRLGFNFTRMCVSKREGHGSLFGLK